MSKSQLLSCRYLFAEAIILPLEQASSVEVEPTVSNFSLIFNNHCLSTAGRGLP
jgi:hypothetical protein